MSKILRPKFLLPAIIILALIGFAGYKLINNEQTVKTTPSGVKLTPATKQEKADSQRKKQQITEDQQNSEQKGNTAGDNKKQVSVVITNASSSTVNSYVSGVFEEGGTCTATFTSGAKSLNKQSNGFQNASYTQCAPINLESGFLSPGQWKVTVSYSSTTAEGTSSAQTIEVK